MTFTLTAAVLDSADPPALARFYQQLLGWPIGSEDPTWVTLRPDGGGQPEAHRASTPNRRAPFSQRTARSHSSPSSSRCSAASWWA